MNNVYQSATIKLTAWYLTLAMAISIIFSAVLYHVATNQIANSLGDQTRRIYQQFPVFSGNPFFVRDSDASNGSHHILIELIYINLLVLLVAGFASYWLARRTLRPIEASNERQKRFVADASHELRTPVTSLKMSAEVALLDDSLSKDELREAIKSNLEDADKLEALLNNLLRLSQLESNELRQRFTNLTVQPIVLEAIGQISQQAEAKHINIVDESKNEPLIGDADSLIQLLVILLDNAIKYSPEKSTVTILTKRHQQTTVITVSDQGVGIEPKALEHVFDRFYRADKARGGNNGFGLGLSIAQHIASLHDGAITLTSTAGKGTKAEIVLPSEHVLVEHKPSIK
jgi:two-component system sensor histidine kinase CiaH